MGSYQDLHQKFINFMGKDMVKFQPSPNYKLTYPCLLYSYTGGRTEFAQNYPYMYTRRYTVTLITRDSTSDLPDRFAMTFPMCVHDRSFVTDNLYHHIFTLYY